MAARNAKLQSLCYLLLIVSTLIIIIEGDVVLAARPFSPSTTGTTSWTGMSIESSERVQVEGEEGTTAAAAAAGISGGRRRLVGSRAPICTYNECRGCRHRCSARGVPVDASDPINSAYRYKCFCHI